ncbi:MAG: FAD-binding oxidoreductase [Pseudomonadota bacterium]
MSTLLDALRAHVPVVSDDPVDLRAAARDLWPRATLATALGRPSPQPAAVCWPETHEQVCALLTWAQGAGVPLVPYGAGSGVCGGAAGMPGAVVVDLKRMHRILELDPERRVVSAEPGVLGQHLEDWLEARGLATRHSPSSIWCSSVGGWAAARSAGQFSSLYGKFEDMVLGMRVASPRGTHLTGRHCPPGEEDFGPLFMGSEGTLGIITRIDTRVVPLPAHRWLRAYAFPDLEQAWSAMRAVMQAELWPAVVRLYCPVDTRIGGRLGPPKERAAPGLLRRTLGRHVRRLLTSLDELEAVRRRELALGLAAPHALNRIAQALGREVLLILGWEGREEVVRAQVEAALPLLGAGRDLGPEPGEHWYAHRHAVSWKLAPVFERGGFADTMEVAATWSRLGPLYRAVRDALARHAAVMAHFSHAYPEGCSIYFSFAGAGDLDRYDAAWRDALQAVRLAGGTVTHHHGVGALKAEAATLELGNALRVYQRRKAMLDPGGVMNPGRLFGGAPPPQPGPARPSASGPLFALHPQDLLAEVDPWAAPDELEAALARAGFALRLRPGEPLATWLPRWRPSAAERHEQPCFGLQARFSDGAGARLGLAPRSAAGPDLRWGLLRDARVELVEVPVMPLAAPRAAVAIRADRPWSRARDLLAEGWRPAGLVAGDGTLQLEWVGAAAPALAAALAAQAGGELVAPGPLPERAPDLVPAAQGQAGATSHDLLTAPPPEGAHG